MKTSAPESRRATRCEVTAELIRLDHVAEPERDDAEDGADQRSEGGARDEGEDVPDPLERDSLRVSRRNSTAATTTSSVFPTV